MHETYGDLFCEADGDVEIPPRSRLYNLPIADGGPQSDLESLLSYLHRLARRHQVKIKDLMVKVVLPETSIQGVPCSYRFTSEYARSINGYGKYSSELHRVLTALTQVPDLGRGTFLSWRHLFDGKGAGLLHPTRRWCPSCLAEGSASSGDGLAQPLLWACTVVTHCPVHGCPLVETCLKCGAKQAQISDGFTFGRCSACGAFLGWRSSLFESNGLSERQLFVNKAVRQMIAANENVADIARPENFGAGLRCVAKQTHQGVLAQLARAIQIDYKVMLEWIQLEKRPRFDSFIETCYRLGAMPLDLLQSSTEALIPQLRPGSQPLKRPFHKLSAEQLQRAKDVIHGLLDSDDQFVSAKRFAAEIGTSVGHLRYQLPDEYRLLVEHRLKLKAAESQRRAAEKADAVRLVVGDLVQNGRYVSTRMLSSALAEKGISVLCPKVREVAKDELRKMRNDWRPQSVPPLTSQSSGASESLSPAACKHDQASPHSPCLMPKGRAP